MLSAKEILIKLNIKNDNKMKKLFTIALVGVFALSACAQKKAEEKKEVSYTVSGTCAADAKMVYVVDPMNPRAVADSAMDHAESAGTFCSGSAHGERAEKPGRLQHTGRTR